MTGNTDVVVIGGGYAGVMAANRLTQRNDVTVTLINKEFICRHTVEQLADESRKPGSHTWAKGGDKRRQLLQAKRGEALARATAGPGDRYSHRRAESQIPQAPW